uniref:Homoserine kinase n=1 Tax=Dictyoglomus thermophilum TaxID=14 RepID=A0A7C3RMF8_DICTH
MIYHIKVPATSANIGPGFDSIGIAWNLYLHIYIKKDESHKDDIRIINKNKINNDLFIKAFNETINYINKKPSNYIIELWSEIPIGKGLGSSASAIVGGIYTAEIITNTYLNLHEKLNIALKFENHLDNISAAINGGINICLKNEKEIYISKLPINYDFWGLLYIPDYYLSTQEARSILPHNYKREDVVFNLQKFGILISGLFQKDEKLVKMGLDDKIHQPYRFELIKEYPLLSKEVEKHGKKIVLSGSGPSLLVLLFNEQEALEILEKLENNLKEALKGEFKLLKIEHNGITLEKLN